METERRRKLKYGEVSLEIDQNYLRKKNKQTNFRLDYQFNALKHVIKYICFKSHLVDGRRSFGKNLRIKSVSVLVKLMINSTALLLFCLQSDKNFI